MNCLVASVWSVADLVFDVAAAVFTIRLACAGPPLVWTDVLAVRVLRARSGEVGAAGSDRVQGGAEEAREEGDVERLSEDGPALVEAVERRASASSLGD